MATKRVATFVYDFAVDGGAISTITPASTKTLPKGAMVRSIASDEQTPFTSGGSATVRVKCGSINLTDALAFNSAFTGADTHALASSAESIDITTAGELSIAVAAAALTAGKVVFYVEYDI